MVESADVNRYRAAASEASRRATTELTNLLDRVRDAPAEQIKPVLLDALPGLVDRHGDVLATAAAEWYEQIREAPGAYTATLGPRVQADAVAGTVRYAMKYVYDGDLPAAGGILAGAMHRWVLNCGRGTILANVKSDPSKPVWARVPTGAVTCAFCAMLASRGWVYSTRETAGAEREFHDHCDCQIVPSWDKAGATLDGYDPEAMYARYLQARDGLFNPSTSDVLRAMRLTHPDWYTDGSWPQLPNGATKDGTMQFSVWEKFVREMKTERNALGDAFGPNMKLPPARPAEAPKDWPSDLPTLRAKELNHILYGNLDKDGKRRGGHLDGYGWVSDGDTFPPGWTTDDVVDAIEAVIRIGGNDANHRIAVVRGIRIEVRLSPRGHIVTAFPRTRD